MRPLPSDSTTAIVPVEATPKFAPDTATGTERNFARRCSRAALASSRACQTSAERAGPARFANLRRAGETAPGDRQRIVRALELLDAGELEPPSGESELWTHNVRRPTLLVGLVMDREHLYRRIDARVERMLAAGVEDEVRRANAAGASTTARKALGFEELLAGEHEAMKRRTRNYARRQLTWMRKLAGVNVVDTTERAAADVAREIIELWLRTAAA